MLILFAAIVAALPAATAAGLAATGAAMGLQNVAEKRRLEAAMGLAEMLAPLPLAKPVADRMVAAAFTRTPIKIGGREYLLMEGQRAAIAAALNDGGNEKLQAICMQIAAENAQAA